MANGRGAARRFELRASGLDYLVFLIIQLLLVCVTLGIWLFLLPGLIDEWRFRHTWLEGQRLRFRAGLGECVAHGLINLLLFLGTCGLALPYISYRNVVFLYDNLDLPGGRRIRFQGGFLDYILLAVCCWLLTLLTLGLFGPWARALLVRWRVENASLDGGMLRFHGTGSGALGHLLLSWLLSYVTCGLYWPWAVVRMWRWEMENIEAPATAADDDVAPDPLPAAA